jgi:hypothetical protein
MSGNRTADMGDAVTSNADEIARLVMRQLGRTGSEYRQPLTADESALALATVTTALAYFIARSIAQRPDDCDDARVATMLATMDRTARAALRVFLPMLRK